MKKLCPVKPSGMLQWIFKISRISMIFKVQFQHEKIPALWRQAHLIPKHGQPRSRGCHPAGSFLNLQLERGEYGADPQGHGHEKLHFLCMVQNEVFQTRLLKTHQNTTRKVVPWGKLTQKYWAIDLSTLNRTFIKKFHLCNMSDIGC